MKKVSVICIDCESNYIDRMLGIQTYQNLEVVEVVTGKDFYQDIAEYCETTDSDFICFLESNQIVNSTKIQKMVENAGRYMEAAVILCGRCYAKEDGTIVAYPDYIYQKAFKDTMFDGTTALRRFLEMGNNLLGNLTATMFRRDRVKLHIENLRQYDVDENPAMQKAFLLFEILAGQIMVLCEESMMATYVEKLDVEKLKKYETLFESRIEIFRRVHGWEAFDKAPMGISAEHMALIQERDIKDVAHKPLKKEITFFAMNKGEYYNLLPIMDCARERGYEVSCTDDLDVEAEIGVYCQHFAKPQNSKFSVVLLHDMAQGHNRWPNIWELERWNVYDIGIVPGEDWRGRWEDCAFRYYANPRCGAYMLGYPKSTQIFSEELRKRAEELRASMELKYDISILYAPSWEYGDKEDDFVRVLASLPVNLLVKQAPWAKGYGDTIVNNVKNMRELHEGKYDNLHYFEWDESILVPLIMCDLVVSDESSVMVEALMFGKPSVAVMDWLIPDTNPVRYSSVPFEFVYKCKKAELREQVEQLLAAGLENADKVKDAENFFVNKENVNRDIIDAIEYFTTGKGSDEFMKWKMSPRYMPTSFWA